MQNPTNLDFVSFQVSDMKKSEDFYVNVLGFKKGPAPNPHATVFETDGGSIFAIRTPIIDLQNIAEKGAGISVWFKVSDADELFLKIQKEEVPLIKPIENGPFGRVFIISDPDGYAITIHGGN